MSEEEPGGEENFRNLFRTSEVVSFLIFVVLIAFFFMFLKQSGGRVSNKGSPTISVAYGKSEKEIGSLMTEIRNGGDMPPLEDDFVMDKSTDLASQDHNIVIKSEKTEQYLNLILLNLQKNFPDKWKARVIKFRVYDDRYVGKINNAFSLPAETVYVGITQILHVNDEAEMAALLSHEVSHIMLRHSAQLRKVIKNSTIFLQRAFIKKDFEKVVLIYFAVQKLLGTTESAVGIVPMEFETEADRMSQTIIRDSGYDDLALAVSLERIEKTYGGGIFTQIMLKRIRDLKNGSKKKPGLAHVGKAFIVSNKEDLNSVQANLQRFIDELALK